MSQLSPVRERQVPHPRGCRGPGGPLARGCGGLGPPLNRARAGSREARLGKDDALKSRWMSGEVEAAGTGALQLEEPVERGEFVDRVPHATGLLAPGDRGQHRAEVGDRVIVTVLEVDRG